MFLYKKVSWKEDPIFCASRHWLPTNAERFQFTAAANWKYSGWEKSILYSIHYSTLCILDNSDTFPAEAEIVVANGS